MQLASPRVDGGAVDSFTERTYELVEAWVAETGRGWVDDEMLGGDASAIVLASDLLIARGTPSWDACGREVVLRIFEMGFGVMAPSFGDAVVAFRRWLAAKGHAGTDGMEALEACVRELAAEPPSDIVTVSGSLSSSPEAAPRNRHERRVLAAHRRREARRDRRAR